MRNRLQEELKRLNLSSAKASRLVGFKTPQNLYNILSGHQKMPAEFLGKLAPLGVDVVYVLTGTRNNIPSELSPDEAALVDDFRHLSREDQNLILLTSKRLSTDKS